MAQIRHANISNNLYKLCISFAIDLEGADPREEPRHKFGQKIYIDLTNPEKMDTEEKGG